MYQGLPIVRADQQARTYQAKYMVLNVVVGVFLVTAKVDSLTGGNSTVDGVQRSTERVDGGVVVQKRLVRAWLEGRGVRSSTRTVEQGLVETVVQRKKNRQSTHSNVWIEPRMVLASRPLRP